METNDSTARFSDEPGDATRGLPRYAVDLAITADSDHNFIAGFATNMSTGGVFIATPIVHDVGTQLRLTIALKDGKTIVRGIGEVRWLRAQQGERLPMGIGVQFLSIESDGQANIEAFLDQQQALATSKDAKRDSSP